MTFNPFWKWLLDNIAPEQKNDVAFRKKNKSQALNRPIDPGAAMYGGVAWSSAGLFGTVHDPSGDDGNYCYKGNIMEM